MATFTVNGHTVTANQNQKLLRFLRDTLRLTSVKDGCSEGACGTCTVLIDGKPTRAAAPCPGRPASSPARASCVTACGISQSAARS